MLYRTVTFTMILTDPKPGFQGHGIFEGHQRPDNFGSPTYANLV